MNHQLLVSSIVCTALLSACNSTNFGKDILNQGIASVTPAPMGQTQARTDSGLPTGSTEPVTYKNNDRKFSFTIPAGWSQQGGDVNSDSVQFMEVPLSKSCSFQISMTRMQPDFPAKASVKASLASAKKDIQIDKLLSAERRDESGLENGKKVKFTRGWQVVEKGQAGGHQRIIYQAYDRQNYYMNLMAAALTEHFEECRPNLERIIDSIKFGD
ncbi:MAG: hypothetical protein ACRESZ_22410 [Methylococcales bacterium]